MKSSGSRPTLAAAAASLLLAGCFGDPPPDPEVQPLEVVVGSRSQPDQPCILNVDEVAAGDHEVSVISEREGAARVVLRTAAGSVVFEASGGQPAPEEAPASVTLTPGDHLVQCLSDGAVLGEVPLRVVPAEG